MVAEPGSGTVAVDENWRMRADPDLVAGWTAAQLGSVLVHHICHLLRAHGERAASAGVGPPHAGNWVRAADAEINDDLIPAGLDLPGRPVLPRDLGAPDGLLAEQYSRWHAPRTVRPRKLRRRRATGSTAAAAPTGSRGPATARRGCPPGRPNCCAGR